MYETFEELGVVPQILKAVEDMGFEEPTPIQKAAIPAALAGKDLIGQAQTGTGKTAAFGIPVLQRIDLSRPAPQAVILSPTRELAVQSAEEINHLAEFLPIHAVPIYGGQDINRQFRALRMHPQIIVATPGRLMDHMKRGSIDLSHVQVLVLDEADEMMDMGFIDDIRTILSSMPEERQTMLFSATMPDPIRELADTFLKEPEHVKVKAATVTIDLIEQEYIELPDLQKFDALCRLLDMQEPDLAIVFVRTKRRADEVTEALKKRGYAAEGIHGDLSQAKRDSVIRQFKENTIDILVATDVAARGLDISGVTHVYNFDMPQDPESYVHRVGRTGRAGRTGMATTFVISREMGQLRDIERLIRRRIRSTDLVMEMMHAGKSSKTDIVICYMDSRVDRAFLEKIRDRIKNIRVDALTMNQESLAECLYARKWYNPFPKFKFTERPDTAAAQVLEGNIVILVDNSPSVLILPTSVFDVAEEADDFYFPPITGTYLRLSRLLIALLTYFLTPTFLLLMRYPQWVPESFSFILIRDEIHVPLIWQFLILELAIDGLRLAAVNTPSMLSTPLSVMAALVLGEFAVNSGWFNSEVMLYMAFVALAGYTQSSYELGYALKFMRIANLILTAAFGIWGYAGGLLLCALCLIGNRTISGQSYLYPLIPFDAKQLKNRFFRTRLPGSFSPAGTGEKGEKGEKNP